MDIGYVIGIVGSVASIWGAIIAYNEARKAKSWAAKAEQIRNDISTEQIKIYKSRLYAETKKIMDITRRMTTPDKPNKKVSGLNYSDSIRLVREYVDSLKEYVHYFSEDKRNLLGEIYGKVESSLISLAREESQQEKYQVGDNIHNNIGEIMMIIKPELDI